MAGVLDYAERAVAGMWGAGLGRAAASIRLREEDGGCGAGLGVPSAWRWKLCLGAACAHGRGGAELSVLLRGVVSLGPRLPA